MRLQGAATFTVLVLLAAQGHTAKPRARPSDAGIASEPRPAAPWEETYGFWRQQGADATVPLAQWIARTPSPVPQAFSPHDWDAMDLGNRTTTFHACLQRQAVDFGVRALRYRSPRLQDVTKMVQEELARRGARVTVAVFWGRERYVSLLWRYLERNLAVNHGIVHEVLLITNDRDSPQGAMGAEAVLQAATAKYPGIVKRVPFCPKAYGCAFDEILVDPHAIYVKLDDDILFIKDGSVEHLVYQILFNKDYLFYSGAVVNNPHGYAVHAFVGALPPSTYHWRDLGKQHPPFVNVSTVVDLYYGKNIYDQMGSRTHEAFIYNVAVGRLDLYTFDLWNLNQCQCAYPQPGMNHCTRGFYRWSINAFAFARNATAPYKNPIPKFDEPTISMSVPEELEPHRVAIVGESLFVHGQYTRQRSSKPDYGLRDAILLKWYHMLAEQYCAQPYDSWTGNVSLLAAYEARAFAAGEDRYSRNVNGKRWDAFVAAEGLSPLDATDAKPQFKGAVDTQ